MTPEDIEQIRQIVTAEISASEARMTAKQDRAVETIAGEFTELRAEMRRELAALRERLDNLAPSIISTDARMAGFTRSLDKLIGAHSEAEATRIAQQRAIDDLYAQVAEIKRRLDQPRQ